MIRLKNFWLMLILPLIIGCSGSSDSYVKELGSKNSVNRSESIGRISLQGNDPKVVKKIVKLLKNEDERVVLSAIEILGNMGKTNDQENLKALLGMAENPNFKYRVETVYSLGKIGDPSVVPYLVKALADSAGNVRLAAVTVLGDLRPMSEIKSVYKMMSDNIVTVRSAAVAALFRYGYFNKESGVKAEDFRAAVNDSFDVVRYVAVQALGNNKSYPDSTVAKELLISALDDQDNNVKIEANPQPGKN